MKPSTCLWAVTSWLLIAPSSIFSASADEELAAAHIVQDPSGTLPKELYESGNRDVL